MKKLMAMLLSVVLIFTLAGCKDNEKTEGTTDDIKTSTKSTQTKVPSKYKNYAIPKNIAIYPGAKRYGDVGYAVYKDDVYLKWHYQTNANATEIYEFYKTEFTNMGFEVEGLGTYLADGTFAVMVWDPVKTDRILISISYVDTEELPEDVTSDTSGRNYFVNVNIDIWNSRY